MRRASAKKTTNSESSPTVVRAKPLRGGPEVATADPSGHAPWEVTDEPVTAERAPGKAADQGTRGDEVAGETAPTDVEREETDERDAEMASGSASQEPDGTVVETTSTTAPVHERVGSELPPEPVDGVAREGQAPGAGAAPTDDNTDTASKKLDEVIARLQRDHTVLQRARITLEGKEPFEAVNGGAGRGGDRRSEAARRERDQTDTVAVRPYAAYVAERTGLDERTVMRDVQIASGVELDVVETIFARCLPIANETTRLLRLCKLPAAQQRRAVRLYANEGKDAFDAVVSGFLAPAIAEPVRVEDGTSRETAAHDDGVGAPPGRTGEDDATIPIANDVTQAPGATEGANDDDAKDVPPAPGGVTRDSFARATNGAPTEMESQARHRPTEAPPSPTALRDREAIQILRARAEGEARLRSLFPSIAELVLAAALADEAAWVRRRNQAGARTVPFLRRRTRANERLHELEQECATAAAAIPSSQRQAFVDVQRDAAALRARPGEVDSTAIDNLRQRVRAARTAAATSVPTPLQAAMADIAGTGRAAE